MSDINTDIENFWREVERELNNDLMGMSPCVLSPMQARLLQLAYLRVPKFQYLLKKIEMGYVFYSVGKNLFEQHLHEWHSLGLLNVETLEQPYKNRLLTPPFIPEYNLDELRELITRRELSPNFLRLWSIYIKRIYIISFLNSFDPYNGANKSAEINESSEVEKYIFAIWMKQKGYKGKRGDKTKFITELAHKLYDITTSNDVEIKKSWRNTHYNAMISTKNGDKNLVTRTVTDMPYETIMEYAAEGTFNTTDFPELFSVT